jgi:hypothetical protein
MNRLMGLVAASRLALVVYRAALFGLYVVSLVPYVRAFKWFIPHHRPRSWAMTLGASILIDVAFVPAVSVCRQAPFACETAK